MRSVDLPGTIIVMLFMHLDVTWADSQAVYFLITFMSLGVDLLQFSFDQFVIKAHRLINQPTSELVAHLFIIFC